MFAKVKFRRAKSRSGSIGWGARRSQKRKRREQRGSAEQRGQHERVAEPAPRLLDQREHRPAEPEHAEHTADHVDARARVGRSARRDGVGHERERGQDEGDVDEEDPAPRAVGDEPAADERADHERDPGPRGPGADRRATSLAARTCW